MCIVWMNQYDTFCFQHEPIHDTYRDTYQFISMENEMNFCCVNEPCLYQLLWFLTPLVHSCIGSVNHWSIQDKLGKWQKNIEWIKMEWIVNTNQTKPVGGGWNRFYNISQCGISIISYIPKIEKDARSTMDILGKM